MVIGNVIQASIDLKKKCTFFVWKILHLPFPCCNATFTNLTLKIVLQVLCIFIGNYQGFILKLKFNSYIDYFQLKFSEITSVLEMYTYANSNSIIKPLALSRSNYLLPMHFCIDHTNRCSAVCYSFSIYALEMLGCSDLLD